MDLARGHHAADLLGEQVGDDPLRPRSQLDQLVGAAQEADVLPLQVELLDQLVVDAPLQEHDLIDRVVLHPGLRLVEPGGPHHRSLRRRLGGRRRLPLAVPRDVVVRDVEVAPRDQDVGQLLEGRRHLGRAEGGHDGHALIDGGADGVAVGGDLADHLAGDGHTHIPGVHPAPAVRPVENRLHHRGGKEQALDQAQRPLRLVQGDHVRRGDQEDQVGRVEGGDERLIERLAAVHDDVVIALLERLEEDRQRLGVHLVDLLRVGEGGQDMDP